MSDSGTEIKKVKAFPFPISIKIGTHVVQGQVLKMTTAGIMVETSSGLVAVGDKLEAEFTLPVMKNLISFNGLVVKFYNQAGGLRIAEIHFKSLSEANKEKVLHYLTAAKVKA